MTGDFAPNSVSGLVLDAICNDYEDFAMVVYEVTRWAAEEGLPVSEAEIGEALIQLIERGLVRAYRAGAHSGVFDVARDTIADPHNWFYVTAEGKRLADERKKD